MAKAAPSPSMIILIPPVGGGNAPAVDDLGMIGGSVWSMRGCVGVSNINWRKV